MSHRLTTTLCALSLMAGTLTVTGWQSADTPVRIECGGVATAPAHITIFAPTPRTPAFRLDVTVEPAGPREDGRSWTTLRATVGTDTLSCEAPEPASFVLDLVNVQVPHATLAISGVLPVELDAFAPGGLPAGVLTLGPGTVGSLEW
jgi:hypothetical protein